MISKWFQIQKTKKIINKNMGHANDFILKGMKMNVVEKVINLYVILKQILAHMSTWKVILIEILKIWEYLK